MIRVAIVEDSPTVREFLTHLIGSDPALAVVGAAVNGEEAVEVIRRCKPDVVTMDIHMPRMDGFEATRRIMETVPTPIVVVSGSTRAHEVAFSFQAVEAGALTVIAYPAGMTGKVAEEAAQNLIRTLKLMSEIKVFRRWAAPGRPGRLQTLPDLPPAAARIRIVAVGASAGGPIALRTILESLTGEFPAPLVIVQHVAPGFTPGLVEWLARYSGMPVHVAEEGERALAGHAYVAPDGVHLTLGPDGRMRLVPKAPADINCPSVGRLFQSVAQSFGADSAGVLLSGMGTDGAREMLLMKDRHAVTIAQDQETSMIHGMPGEAIRLGAATHVLPLQKIASALVSLTAGRPEK